MSLKLTILGCHSAMPRASAHPTAQVLEIKNHTFNFNITKTNKTQSDPKKIIRNATFIGSHLVSSGRGRW